MIDISTLPDFAPEGYQTQELELDRDELLKGLDPETPFLWLESHQGGQRILLLDTIWSLEFYPHQIIYQQGTIQQKHLLDQPISYRKFLNELENTWLNKQPDIFKLAWAMSYEAGWNEEKQRQQKPSTPTPELWCACPQTILVQDPKSRRATLYQPKGLNLPDLSSKRLLHQNYATNVSISLEENTDQYLSKIKRVKNHIRQGDSFQVNLSRGFEAQGSFDLFSWVKHAFEKQSSSFGAFLHLKDFSLLSLSPERLIAGQDQQLITRPIAGTLPRNHNDNASKLKAFKEHPKELAEHNMLIDLERNDLGKVSKPGSVKVEEYLSIESLPHVHHLVSQVIGECGTDQQFGDILFAMFPGGTITGCPKLETMHIIDALETHPRSFYTGSLGYLSKKSFDSNILIRTALIINNQILMRFGGGLVWDSDPEKEVLETYAKARGLINSLLDGGADFDPDHRSLRQFFT